MLLIIQVRPKRRSNGIQFLLRLGCASKQLWRVSDSVNINRSLL